MAELSPKPLGYSTIVSSDRRFIAVYSPKEERWAIHNATGGAAFAWFVLERHAVAFMETKI